MSRGAVFATLTSLILISGCQSTEPPQPQTKVVTVERTTTIIQPAPEPASPDALNVIRVENGQGCPDRDPATYGVFLSSERVENGLLCYYN
jgi:hypothetical protein